MTTQQLRRPTVTAGAALVCALSLVACGSQGADTARAASSSTTTSSEAPTPSTSTEAPSPSVTSSVPTSLPLPTPRGTPNTTMTVPPPAGDPQPVPSNPQAYVQAFVAAWATGDRARMDQLGTPAAVKAVTARAKPATAPVAAGCEGAAGSSYCTWKGDGFTLVVRVLNAASSDRELHAVSEARFTA